MLREPNYTSAECIEDNAEHSEDQTDVQNAECSAQDTGWRLILKVQIVYNTLERLDPQFSN